MLALWLTSKQEAPMLRRLIFISAIGTMVILFGALPALADMIVDTAWIRRYNGPGNGLDEAHAIAVDDSDNVYVTGWAWNGTSHDYATIRYYPDGDTAWVRRYNGAANGEDKAYGIAVDGSGYPHVTGYSYGSGADQDYATVRYHPNGDTVWVRRYNGPGNSDDYAAAVAVDGSGNICVTGASHGIGTERDYATVKYYPSGDTAWVRRYNGPGNFWDQAYAVAVDSSGNIFVTGASYGAGTSSDYATIKYYPNGDTAWVRRYDGPGNDGDWAQAISVGGSGDVYVTGASHELRIDTDYTTIKYYPNGDTAWVRRYDGPGNGEDWAQAISVDGSGNIYVSGYSYGAGTNVDYATIKYHPNGNTAWVRRYNGAGNDGDWVYAMDIDDSDNVYVTGVSLGDTSREYATIK
jgi:hypothetical protein